MRRNINLAALALIVSVISYFSLSTGSKIASSGLGFLPLHGIAYFVLAAGLIVNFHDTDKGHIEAVFSAFIFGIFMEVLQLHVPERTFSIRDIGMNLAGASMVMLDHRVRIVTEFVRVEDKLVKKTLEKTGL